MEIKKGKLLQRRKEADSKGRGGIYRVLDVREEQFENFGKNEVIYLGRLGTNELKTFTGREVTIPNGWKEYFGKMKMKMVTYFELPDGSIEIVKEKPYKGNPENETTLSKALKEVEANLIHKLDNPEETTQVENKTVIINQVVEEDKEEIPTILDLRFANTYTYHQINLLGHTVKGNQEIEKFIVGGFYTGSKIAHEQMLCRWKEGNISVLDLVKETYTLDGQKKISYTGGVHRLLKAIYKCGTDEDRKHFDW